MLMMPNFCVLFCKTGYGIRWLFYGMTRPEYQTYFQVSWSFYTSFVIQFSVVTIYTWKVFNDKINSF